MPANPALDWHVRLDDLVAESEIASVDFERRDSGVRVYAVRPKTKGVDERWAADVAGAARAAIERHLAQSGFSANGAGRDPADSQQAGNPGVGPPAGA